MPKIELRRSDVTAIQARLSRMEVSFSRDVNALGGTTERNASLASKELQNNITTQKFAGDYPALQKSYLKWKAARGFSSKFWIRMGELFSAITRFKSGRGWVAGIPDNARNSEGNEVADYAKANEFGRGNIPSRPLFTQTANEIMTQGWAEINWVKSVSRIVKLIWR